MSKKIEDLIKELQEKTTIGKEVKCKVKEREGAFRNGLVIDEVAVMDEDEKYKRFIQKIEYTDIGTQYRICYYTIRTDGKGIAWGQFASEMGAKELSVLINEAIKKWQEIQIN